MIKNESPSTTTSVPPVPTMLLEFSPAQRNRASRGAVQPQNTQISRCALIAPLYTSWLTVSETQNHDLLSLQWPSAPRNILLIKKNDAPAATAALLEFAQYGLYICCRPEATNRDGQTRSRNLSLHLLYS